MVIPQADYHRHDISDDVWAVLEPHMIGKRGQWGGIAKDNRLFLNAVFWVIRTGAPWRDLPPDYGNDDARNSWLITMYIQLKDKNVNEQSSIKLLYENVN